MGTPISSAHCVAVCVLLCNLLVFSCYLQQGGAAVHGGRVGAVGWMKAGGTIYHSVSPLSSQNPRLFFS